MHFYFDQLTPAVSAEFQKRGISEENLLYCVRADLDDAGQFADNYLAFDSEYLYVLRGRQSGRLIRRRMEDVYTADEFLLLPMKDFEEMSVDRYRNSSRIIVKMKADSAESENSEKIDKKAIEVARFSSGFDQKMEKFITRFNKTVKGEEIDDATLSEELPVCPRCGKPYPDPNRKYCPYCAKRSGTVKRLFGLFGSFKKEVAAIMALMLISVGLGLVAPYFSTRMLYDEVLNQEGSMYGQIGYVVTLIILFQVFSTGFTVVYGLIVAHITPQVAHKLRCAIFDKMKDLSLSFFSTKQSSSLMTRVDDDALAIYNFFTDIVPWGIMNILRLAGLTALMIGIRWELAIGMILFDLLLFVMEIGIIRTMRRHWRQRNLARRGVNLVLTDALHGHRVVKAFSREQQEIKRFGGRNDGLFKAQYDADMTMSAIEPAQRGLFTVAFALLFIFGLVFILNGDIAFGSLTLLSSYAGQAFGPMFFLIHVQFDITRVVDAGSRMFEILDSEPSVKPPEHPIIPENETLKGNIRLNDVSFEYEPGRPILKHMSIEVKAGQFFGIVGRTGAGKSTIINLISRMYDPTNGEITIDGIPLKSLDFGVLRKNIGVVSQETYLFMGSIADNIRYANPEADMKTVVEAAKSANAHDFIMKLPDGYDTRVGSGGQELSGGEKQRVSIARALIQKPNILILDEATAAMDTKTERRIQSAIDQLKHGRTIIAIAHRLSTLRDADTLCVIENGEVKEQGTHDELIRKDGKYRELHKLQAEALKAVGIE
jgi:ATP-binding cassette subfamily B protein